MLLWLFLYGIAIAFMVVAGLGWAP